MTNIYLNIDDEKYIVKYLTFNLTINTWIIDTEKFESCENAYFSRPPDSTKFEFIKISSKTLLERKLWACKKPYENSTLHLYSEWTQ